MSSSAIFGREPQLAAADGFLSAANSGFSVLRLRGEPGIGKTTVWREVIRRARSGDFRGLSCRPAQAETKLALSGLADLIDPVESEAYSGLPPPQRHALEVALLRAEPVAAGAGPDPRALAAARPPPATAPRR